MVEHRRFELLTSSMPWKRSTKWASAPTAENYTTFHPSIASVKRRKSISDIIYAMKKKMMKLYKEHREIANYLIVGGLTTLVSLVVKYALLFTILDAKDAIQLQIAVIISWIISVAFAYWANRKFVFESKSKQIAKEIGLFVASRISTLLLDMLIMWFFVTLLQLNSNTWVIIWTVISQVLVIVANYILSKFFVFRKK